MSEDDPPPLTEDTFQHVERAVKTTAQLAAVTPKTESIIERTLEQIRTELATAESASSASPRADPPRVPAA